MKIFCVDCDEVVGTTSCEITATSPHHCEACHDMYINGMGDDGGMTAAFNYTSNPMDSTY